MKKLSKRSIIQEKINLLEEKRKIMGLTSDDEKELETLKTKLTQSKRGLGSKRKGASYERKIASVFKRAFGIELTRTPQSGGFAKKSKKADDFRGDIVCLDDDVAFKLHIECKDQKTWKLREWLKQASEDCPTGSTPCVIFHQAQENKDGKRVQESCEFIALPLEDFLSIVDTNKIIKKKGE